MLERMKKFKSLTVRSYLVLIPAALFLYLGILNSIAQTPDRLPQPERVNITPSAFEIISNGKPEYGWQNPGAALFAENGESARFGEFNSGNSAFFKVGEFASTTSELPAVTPTSDNIEKQVTSTPGQVEDSTVPAADVPPANNNPASESTNGGQSADSTKPDCTQATTCTAPDNTNPLITAPFQGLQPVESPAPNEPVVTPPAEVPAAPAPAAEAPTSRLPLPFRVSKLSLAPDLIRERTPLAVNLPGIRGLSRVFEMTGKKLFNFFQPQRAQAQNAVKSTPSATREYAVVYKDFSLPAGSLVDSSIANVQLRLSLAAKSANPDDKVKVYYNIGSGWFDTGVLFINKEIDNQGNQGYFLFGLPIFESWKDLSKLQIKVVYEQAGDGPAVALLDGIWLEVDYAKIEQAKTEPPKEQLNKETRLSHLRDLELNAPFTLEQVSKQTSFKTSDKPDFNFLYRRKQGVASELLSGLLGLFSDQYQGVQATAEIVDEFGKTFRLQPNVNYLAGGEFHVGLPNRPRSFRPGKYAMVVNIQDGDQAYASVKDFSWGVLAINTNKSIYLPGEEAYLQMGVLDDFGNTICNADLYLEVTAPDGGVAQLNTDNGLLTRNFLCGPNNVISEPDYFAHYGLAGAGIYQMKLMASTKNGIKEITDQFEVHENVPFEVERIGPTRIWPVANYHMDLNIKANENYNGDITDIMPANFQLVGMVLRLNGQILLPGVDYDFKLLDDHENEKDTKILAWQRLKLKTNDSLEINYEFDAPDISPEFFLLGPMTIGTFKEARLWQIASDAVTIMSANAGSAIVNGDGFGWLTMTNAWDSVNNTYATRSVAAGANETTTYIRATDYPATSSAETITKVEVGIEGRVANTALNVALRPLFNGTATGTAQQILGTLITTSDTGATYYVDVTGDAAGPGAANWTWTDVQNLDVLVHGSSTSGSRRILYLDQIRLQVTSQMATKPIGTFNSLAQKTDGSGAVNLSLEVSDTDGNLNKAKLEYIAGGDCNFSYPEDPTITTDDASTTADFGDPKVDNASAYQIGTTTGWIVTASGSNTILTDWNSKTDLPNGNGVYCMRLTTNDGTYNSTSTFATTTIDNLKPTTPGIMTATTSSLGNGITLGFGATSSDTNFKEYKIFYRQGTSSVSETDTVLDKNTYPDLGYANYNSALSLTVNDLLPQTDYVFNIWAYDQYGNRASSTEITIKTGKAESLRANTVYFFAGQYSANGTVGQNSDTAQTFSPTSDFDFSLAETGAKIKNAYIIFEAQFEAYVDNVGNYTGYDLKFDTCQKPCTPNAQSGTGAVSKTDSTILAYDESESNYVRLLFDVTDEAQLAAYSGDGAEMLGQVAYNIKRGAAVNSIAMARAMLVVTYQYAEKQTTSLTNTVVYPLESATNVGTKVGVQTTGCTPNSNCPKFSYNVDIPEYGNTLSQWFQSYAQSDVGATTDLSVSANIQGTDASSPNQLYEQALGGGQSTIPVMFIDNLGGYAENTNQQIEYEYNNSSFYLLGGEVYETYAASSSAAVKTRTVSFPLGVLNNGGLASNVITNASTSVYFPENGLTSGTVAVKKAWIRLISNNITSAGRTVSVSTKTGNNAQTANVGYAYNPDGTVTRPSFNIFHLIPSADYAELASANISSPKKVIVYESSNVTTNQGGVSAELVVTYAYSSELAGHLTSLNLYGGQSYMDGATQLATMTVTSLIAPEANDAKTMLAGSLLSSYLLSDSAGTMPAGTIDITVDANVGTTSPTCTSAFITRTDAVNAYNEFNKQVTLNLPTNNNTALYSCYSVAGDAQVGGKMNGQLIYTYKYDAPQPLFVQDNWQWWNNINALNPLAYRASERVGINNINLADTVRLRLAAGPVSQDLLANSQDFKLQYGYGSTTCSAASMTWVDVGTTTSTSSWRSFDNSLVEDGSSTGATLLSNTALFQSYEEDNPSVLNPQALADGTFGEYDWVVYNNSATSALQYCFRLIRSSGSVLKTYNYYPWLVTAASNTAPSLPSNLMQYSSSTGSSTIVNGAWLNQQTVRLVAQMTDVNINQAMSLYFQLATSSGNFLTATSVPAGACASTTAYTACPSKVWLASSTVGDYRVTPFVGTATISVISQDYAGYKWQVLACDNGNSCSAWVNPDVAPQFRLDLTQPTKPGTMTVIATTTGSVTLLFGASTTEANFSKYRIFYKKGTSSVSQTDLEQDDGNLLFQDYNGATTTTVSSLSAGTAYVFNIWAYDLAGNSTSSVEVRATTTPSFTSPSVSLLSGNGQATDGTGAVHVGIVVDDPDNDDILRARMEYDTYDGVSCKFNTPAKMTIDPTDANTYAYTFGTFDPAGDPKVDNGAFYQIGTTTGWILTSPGPSTVYFDWSSKLNIPNADGNYCMRAIAYDGTTVPATSTATLFTSVVLIDNVNPTVPGALSVSSKNAASLTVRFGATSTDSHFDRYRIFYSTTSPVSELNQEQADNNLFSQTFNAATTTTISGLQASTTYYINIWAYDINGNRASSTQLQVKTNTLPTNASSTNQVANGQVVLNGGWITTSTVMLAGQANDSDTVEKLTLYFELIDSANSFTSATSVPANACGTSTVYSACASKIWQISTTTTSDYSVTPFVATATIAGLATTSTNYKWQMLACDDDGDCSNWSGFNAAVPNFKLDTIKPTAPGQLTYNAKTSTQVILSFGSSTTEANFLKYRLLYATGSPPTASSSEQLDANLDSKNYNGASLITVTSLEPGTQYYFSLWAYDQAGQIASSSAMTVTTNNVQSTPGVYFYTKNTKTLYYRKWTGSGWGAEQAGPATFGSGVTDYIRQIETLPSDDRGKIAIVVKTWDGTNQEIWGSVYRVAANNFATTTQLGATYAAATYNNLITSCIGSLSSGQFMVVKSPFANSAVQMYTWDASAGWVSQGLGPNPTRALVGCRLVRQPGTDNYLLSVYDSGRYFQTAFYSGGATYNNGAWSSLTLQNTGIPEPNLNNFVGEAIFDPGDPSRGVFNYSATTTGFTTVAEKFSVTAGVMSGGSAVRSPQLAADSWSALVQQGKFSADPGSTGIAYLIGDDANSQLNVYRLDITNTDPIWSTTTNGKNIASGSAMYAQTNFAQRPFDMTFFKDHYGLVTWTTAAAATPKYKVLDANVNYLDNTISSVPNANAAIWSRTAQYRDPNEPEVFVGYQSASNYAGVFWAASSTFYSSGNQAWFNIATTTPFSLNDQAFSFNYTGGNSAPNTPTSPYQLKSDAITALANQGWSTSTTVYFGASATDPDTSEMITLYVQLATTSENLITDTAQPSGACTWGTAYGAACPSSIWFVASSSVGDYSVTPFTDKVSITGIPASATGYKWQVISCDSSAVCSNWVTFNNTLPNFKVDATPPSNPGNLTIAGRNSNSVTLAYGTQSSDINFSNYRIFYASSSGVTEQNAEWSDANLATSTYSGATSTTVTGLASSTQYYFRIWAYDLAGNKSSSTAEVATTTLAGPIIAQTSYIFENDDGVNVNSNSTSTQASTSLTNVLIGQRINARIQIDNRGGDVASNKVYKLQFATSSSNWFDVDNDTAEINFGLGLSGANGNAITANKAATSSKTWADGTWHEQTALTSANSLGVNYFTEFVFALRTQNAVPGQTYRLRLINNDNSPLSTYVNYPLITIASTNILRYSKGAYPVLPGGNPVIDSTYYLDSLGYNSIAAVNGVYDSLAAVSQIPVLSYFAKNSTNTQAVTATWNGQTTVAASVNPVYLQVYHGGSIKAWETVATNTLAAANSDFSISYTLNAKLSEYYDANYWTYWRIYQESGTETLRGDQFTVAYSSTTPFLVQKHYRWRENNGTEVTAAWREAEDAGSPTASSTAQKGDVLRLRMSAVNMAAGATSTRYRLEYASTTGSCVTDPGGWVAVATDNSKDFRMSTTTTITDQTATAKRLSDSEGYAFTAGRVVASTSNMSNAISLSEGYYTENEYAFIANNSVVNGTTYCFRMTASGTPLNSYDRFAEITIGTNSNAAPYFIPSDMPSDGGSSIVSPTNYGDNVVFTGTASDTPGELYYLAVCKTNSVTAGNNAPPTCNGAGNTLCVSAQASSTGDIADRASCAYSAATTSEVVNWYAFVCDKQSGAGVAKCSAASQGAGVDPDFDSPVIVNHAPSFSMLYTQLAAQDPGSTFVINSTSSDPDIYGNADTFNMFVCLTNAATKDGCTNGPGDTLCSVYATTTNASCSFADVAPTPSGTTTYYGFVFDEHDLAATTNSKTNTYAINGVTPIISTPVLNNGLPIYLNPRGATDTVVVATATVSSTNGCQTGLQGTIATIFMSKLDYSCAFSSSTCYQLGTSKCIKSDCVDANDSTATYTCTTPMAYFAAPTDNTTSNPNEPYVWYARLGASSPELKYGFATSTGVEVMTTVVINVTSALYVDEPLINFGSNLTAGSNTGTVNQPTNIVNAGNSPIDTNVAGDDMDSGTGDTIAASNLRYSLTSGFNWLVGTSLSNSDVKVETNLLKATTTAGSARTLYWGIGIPGGKPSKTYNGKNTFTALLDPTLWQ